MNLLIVDLEATCWNEPGFKRRDNEIIEIGACVVDKFMNPLSEFQRFIKPVRHHVLSNFCKELTHISQEDVDKAKDFPLIINEFISWIKTNNVFVWGSWGQYDINQILFDCYYHQVLFPFFPHVNLKNVVSEKLNISPKGIGNMLSFLNLKFEGTQHRALEDVKNIVRILQKIEYRFII